MKQRKFLVLIPAVVIFVVTFAFAGRALFMSHSTPAHAATDTLVLDVFTSAPTATFQSYKILINDDSNGCKVPNANDTLPLDNIFTTLTVGDTVQIQQYATKICSGETSYSSTTNIAQAKTYVITLPTNKSAT
jgi:hypothetical protein